MQVHPHFLFDTLRGITTLVDRDAKGAKTMIIKLSNLLRKALDRESSYPPRPDRSISASPPR